MRQFPHRPADDVNPRSTINSYPDDTKSNDISPHDSKQQTSEELRSAFQQMTQRRVDEFFTLTDNHSQVSDTRSRRTFLLHCYAKYLSSKRTSPINTTERYKKRKKSNTKGKTLKSTPILVRKKQTTTPTTNTFVSL